MLAAEQRGAAAQWVQRERRGSMGPAAEMEMRRRMDAVTKDEWRRQQAVLIKQVDPAFSGSLICPVLPDWQQPKDAPQQREQQELQRQQQELQRQQQELQRQQQELQRQQQELQPPPSLEDICDEASDVAASERDSLSGSLPGSPLSMTSEQSDSSLRSQPRQKMPLAAQIKQQQNNPRPVFQPSVPLSQLLMSQQGMGPLPPPQKESSPYESPQRSPQNVRQAVLYSNAAADRSPSRPGGYPAEKSHLHGSRGGRDGMGMGMGPGGYDSPVTPLRYTNWDGTDSSDIGHSGPTSPLAGPSTSASTSPLNPKAALTRAQQQQVHAEQQRMSPIAYGGGLGHPSMCAGGRDTGLREQLLRSYSGASDASCADSYAGSPGWSVELDVSSVNSECLNIRDVEGVAADMELERAVLEGITIVPLPMRIKALSMPEQVLYALHFSSSPTPLLPGDDSILPLFPTHLQRLASCASSPANNPQCNRAAQQGSFSAFASALSSPDNNASPQRPEQSRPTYASYTQYSAEPADELEAYILG